MGKKKWWILASITWMTAIFIVTQLPYFTGKNTAEVIKKTVVQKQNSVSAPSASKSETIDIATLNLIVRKTTHVLVFGILSVLLFKMLEPYRFSYILAWLLTVLYAISDEWHQSFMPGRVAAFWDVLFDALGAAMFLSLFYLINKIKKKNI